MLTRWTCIVPNCRSTDKSVSKYRFPLDTELGEKWLNVICSPTLRNIPYHEIREKRYVVCEKHFEKNTWYLTSRFKKLKPDVVPTLRLPDSRNWQPICIHPDKEIDLKSCNHENISINDENEDETKLDNIFAQEFSSSFKYSDSPNFLDAIHFELPIRGKETSDSFEIKEPFLIQLEKKETVCKQKNRSVVSQTLKRPSTDYLESTERLLENMSPGLDSVMESVQDISKRVKKPRLELENENFESVEEPAVIEMERFECDSDNTENEEEMDVAAFEVLQSDDSSSEDTTSILRNISSGKKNNKEELKKFFVGEAKHAELSYIGRKAFNTEKNIKRQKYKTKIKLKRHSKENGKIVEDIFIIEHTFMSTCNKCPNHENDSVSCKVVKVK